MNESYGMIVLGVVLMIASFLSKEISYGMPPHRDKRRYPVTRQVRRILLGVGLVSVVLGLMRVLARFGG